MPYNTPEKQMAGLGSHCLIQNICFNIFFLAQGKCNGQGNLSTWHIHYMKYSFNSSRYLKYVPLPMFCILSIDKCSPNTSPHVRVPPFAILSHIVIILSSEQPQTLLANKPINLKDSAITRRKMLFNQNQLACLLLEQAYSVKSFFLFVQLQLYLTVLCQL